jgi:hypothetical protein
MEYIGRMAAGYSSGLKWNEEAKLKADMMNVPQRWAHVDPLALAAKCREVGLKDDEALQIAEWVRRRQAGRRLVPQRGYRDFRFTIELDEPPPDPDVTSLKW